MQMNLTFRNHCFAKLDRYCPHQALSIGQKATWFRRICCISSTRDLFKTLFMAIFLSVGNFCCDEFNICVHTVFCLDAFVDYLLDTLRNFG